MVSALDPRLDGLVLPLYIEGIYNSITLWVRFLNISYLQNRGNIYSFIL